MMPKVSNNPLLANVPNIQRSNAQAHAYKKYGIYDEESEKWLLPGTGLKAGQGAHEQGYWGKRSGYPDWASRPDPKCFWKRTGAKAFRVCTGSSNYGSNYKRKTPIGSGRGRPRKNPQSTTPQPAAFASSTLPTPEDVVSARQNTNIHMTTFPPVDEDWDDTFDDFAPPSPQPAPQPSPKRKSRPPPRKQPKRKVKQPAKGTRRQPKRKARKGGSFLDITDFIQNNLL